MDSRPRQHPLEEPTGPLAALAQLVLPRWCAGCGHPGVSICLACGAQFIHWFRAEAAADSLPAGLPVWAVTAYVQEAAQIIVAWKSGRRPDLAPHLHALGRQIGVKLAESISFLDEAYDFRRRPTLVVPAPSGWRRRWRGNEIVAPFAQHIAEGLAAAGWNAQSQQVLRRRGGRHHYLSARDRQRERAQSIRLQRTSVDNVGGIVLVDDVLTTGATLAASAARVSELGPVVGAIVLAATPKPVGPH